ncbi:MAG TPA: hypothetical protein VJ697_02865 [Nitrososphaeraceae archaeon]|nr:hypothetical protein [Nitrososphaeraceae archaeon]
MTKASTSTQNNNNVNQIVDFFPGFKLQEEQYGKVKTRNGKSWPRPKQPLELYYENFLYDCGNPLNQCFYMPIDENNIPIKMPDNGPGCRHVVNSIIRIRLADGSSEKLYSLGTLIGYDGASLRRSMACDKSEVWDSIKFGYEKDYNKRTKRFETYCTGPMGQETQYLLEFNKENFDKLYKKTWDGKNPYFKPNRKNASKRVTLIAKDEQSGIAKEIYFVSLENSIDIFLTRPFEELINDSYLPRALREERARFSAGYLAEQQKTEPTPSELEKATTIQPDIKNTSAYK